MEDERRRGGRKREEVSIDGSALVPAASRTAGLPRTPTDQMEALGRFHRSLLGGDDDGGGGGGEEAFLDPNGLCSMSPLQRIYGFAACLVLGSALMFLSLFVISNPIKFALLFSFGNILAIGSTVFVIGFIQQATMMFDPVRIYATSIYIGSVIVALLCALLLHNKILTLLAVIAEICALIWYSLSYVPFARRMASELLTSCCDTEI